MIKAKEDYTDSIINSLGITVGSKVTIKEGACINNGDNVVYYYKEHYKDNEFVVTHVDIRSWGIEYYGLTNSVNDILGVNKLDLILIDKPENNLLTATRARELSQQSALNIIIKGIEDRSKEGYTEHSLIINDIHKDYLFNELTKLGYSCVFSKTALEKIAIKINW